MIDYARVVAVWDAVCAPCKGGWRHFFGLCPKVWIKRETKK